MPSSRKRFDIAGEHPDRVYGAVADVVSAVKEIGQQGIYFKEFPETNMKITQWLQNRPMRFGDNLDADVKEYLAQGVRNLDGLAQLMPLGLAKNQKEVRDRCHALTESMEKVLIRRLQEAQPFKAWNYVKVDATPVTVKQPGQTAWSVEKTALAVKNIARSHFDGSAWKAGMAQRSYSEWAKKAETEAEKPGRISRCRRRLNHGIRSCTGLIQSVSEVR